MADHAQESPLDDFLAEGPWPASGVDLQLVEHPFCGVLNLRGSPGDPGFSAAAQGALGGGVPTHPNTVVRLDQCTAFWLSPDEWLLTTAPGLQRPLLEKLKQRLASVLATIVDVTSGHTTLRLSGTGAADVLAKGCTLDLHSQQFRVGHCAQTNLARATMLIRPVDIGSGFELIVRRSFADYVARWIVDAAGGRARMSRAGRD